MLHAPAAPRAGLPPQLRVPAFRCHPPHRSKPATVAALPPRSFRGLRKPPPGSCSAGDEMNEKNKHPCTSASDFAHSSDNMLITSRRFARSVAPCFKAFHAEKNAWKRRCGKLPHARRIMNARDGALPSTTGGFRRRPAFMPRVLGETNRRSRTSLFGLSRSFCWREERSHR